MDTYVINGVCRCCASQGSSKDIDTSYTWMGGEEIYSKMLRDCFDIALSRSVSGHDGGICELCVTQLRNAYNFKKQVVSTEEMLKKRLNSDQFKPSLVKVELEVHPERISDSDNDMGDHMDQDSGDDHSTKEFLVPIKSEVQEAPEVKPKRRATKAGTSAAKKPKLEAETSKSTPNIWRSPSLCISAKKLVRPVKGVPVLQIPINPAKPNVRKITRLVRKKPVTATKGKPKDKPEGETEDSTKKPKSGLKIDRHQGRKFRETILSLCQHSNANIIKKIDHGGFHCCVCPEKFPEAAQLKEHFISIHNRQEKLKEIDFAVLSCSAKVDVTGLTCALCHQEVDTLELMLDHLCFEHQKTVHEGCNILPFKFDKPGYCCVACEAKFGTFKSLLSHMHAHYNNYICDICQSGFYNKGSMRSHRRTHSSVNDTFACTHCSKTFVTDISRVNHEKRVHLGLKPYTCHHCPEKFQDYYERNDHCIEVHGLKDMGNFQCQACDKRFKRSYALREHVRRHHLMERRYDCNICEKRFWSAQELNDHMLKHTRGPAEFICEKCNKGFSRKRVLQKHMQSHYPVAQYACEACEKTFSQKAGLTYHLRHKHGSITCTT